MFNIGYICACAQLTTTHAHFSLVDRSLIDQPHWLRFRSIQLSLSMRIIHNYACAFELQMHTAAQQYRRAAGEPTGAAVICSCAPPPLHIAKKKAETEVQGSVFDQLHLVICLPDISTAAKLASQDSLAKHKRSVRNDLLLFKIKINFVLEHVQKLILLKNLQPSCKLVLLVTGLKCMPRS